MEEIEDCVEEVFIDFFYHRSYYQAEKGSLQGYLRGMAAHKADDRLRKLYKADHPVSIEEVPEARQPESPHNTERTVLNRERDALLLKLVGDLEETDHEIIMRKYYFRESSKSIAKGLHMSVSAVDTRASRILKRLRKEIEKQGFRSADVD